MRRKRRRGIGPVGTIVLIWVFFAFILPVLRLSGGLIAAGLAIMASVWAANALRRKAEKRKDEQAAIPVQYTEVTPEPEKPAAQEAPVQQEAPAAPAQQDVQTPVDAKDDSLNFDNLSPEEQSFRRAARRSRRWAGCTPPSPTRRSAAGSTS